MHNCDDHSLLDLKIRSSIYETFHILSYHSIHFTSFHILSHLGFGSQLEVLPDTSDNSLQRRCSLADAFV